MNPIADQLKDAVLKLAKEGLELLKQLRKDGGDVKFRVAYQSWYSKALRTLSVLAPDRVSEFRSYYEVDPKRKTLGYGTYVIQDWLKGVAPARLSYPDFDVGAEVQQCLFNQYTILNAIYERAESVLDDIEGVLFSQLQEDELDSARSLVTVSPRAAGTLAGVILESHLSHLCAAHSLTIRKKAPTLSDLNDALRQAGIYNLATWRKLSYLTDLRNLCAHKKEQGPTKDQVLELIEGVQWTIKNVA